MTGASLGIVDDRRGERLMDGPAGHHLTARGVGFAGRLQAKSRNYPPNLERESEMGVGPGRMPRGPRNPERCRLARTMEKAMLRHNTRESFRNVATVILPDSA